MYFLDAIINDNGGGTVTFSNPQSSNLAIADAILYGNDLVIKKISSGSSTITVDYTDSQGVTGTYIINCTFTD